VSDDEMEQLLRKTVLTPAKSKARPAKPTEGEAAEVGTIEKHLRAYALDCLKSDGHLLNGAGRHSHWVLQVIAHKHTHCSYGAVCID
jgi:hypothetical protein